MSHLVLNQFPPAPKAPALASVLPHPPPLSSNGWYYPRGRVRRMYVCGDFHGDLSAAIWCLRDLAAVARRDGPGRWRWVAPPGTVVVVLGDVVDRFRRGYSATTRHQDDSRVTESGTGEQPDEEVLLLRLLNSLAAQAPAHGGALVRLMGNHEFMNYRTRVDRLDDFDPERIAQYTSDFGLGLWWKSGGSAGEEERAAAAAERVHRFRSTDFHSLLAVEARPQVVVQVGGWVLVHGGVTERQVAYCNARGLCLLRDANQLAARFWAAPSKMGRDELEDVDRLLLESDSMLWDRSMGTADDGTAGCSMWVARVMCALNANTAASGEEAEEVTAAAVAHCIQGAAGRCHHHIRPVKVTKASEQLGGPLVQAASAKGINVACTGIWRVDVGMSRAFLRDSKPATSRRPAVLLVQFGESAVEDVVSTIRATRDLVDEEEAF